MDASPRLAEAAPSAGRDFVVTRTFDAPRDLVWKAWTERERLARWWGPKGFVTDPITLDLRPGGIFHYSMRTPDGHEMWGRFVYREIAAPERIVFVSSFSDEAGSVTRAPFSPHWPLEIVNILTLTEEDGRTTITLRGGPIGANDEERRTFEGFFDSMRQGWGGTWDQLADYLARARREPNEVTPCMESAPQKEHAWLQRLVGDWTYEIECVMGPGQEPMTSRGVETVRGIGGLWTAAEGRGEMPGGGPAVTVMTLGYDPRKERFVGTFVGSMMAHLWVYEGSLDAAERVLTLEAEGPSFAGDGKTATFRDAMEIVSDDHRILTSRALGDDGEWHLFMTAHYRRKA